MRVLSEVPGFDERHIFDNKHRVKFGEPEFPVAAAERGQEVVVSLHETFAVGDHDFT